MSLEQNSYNVIMHILIGTWDLDRYLHTCTHAIARAIETAIAIGARSCIWLNKLRLFAKLLVALNERSYCFFARVCR
jgi:hypothetical protein